MSSSCCSRSPCPVSGAHSEFSRGGLALGEARAWGKALLTGDENEIKGQEWKGDKVKDGKGKSSPSHRHKSLITSTRRANYPARPQSACEGLKSCGDIQQPRSPARLSPRLPQPCRDLSAHRRASNGGEGPKAALRSDALSMRDARTLSTRKRLKLWQRMPQLKTPRSGSPRVPRRQLLAPGSRTSSPRS